MSKLSAQSLWDEKHLPPIDHVMYADGRMTLLELGVSDDEELAAWRPLIDANIESYVHYHDEEGLAPVDVIAAVAPKSGVLVEVGAGSLEEDGFVALSRKDKLVWVVFLTLSEPLVEVSCNEDSIVVTSENEHRWQLAVDHPELGQTL